MYYTVAISGAPEPLPRTHSILGMPADVFFRVSAPLLMGMISAAGLIYAVQGNQRVATTFALTGLIMSSLVGVGQVIALEEERGRL